LTATALTAGSSVLLSLLLIPIYGPLGAAVSALISRLLAFIVLLVIVQRVFPLPVPDQIATRASIAGSCVMALWLLAFYRDTGWVALLYVIPGAAIIYFCTIALIFRSNGLTLSRGLQM